MSIEDHIEKMLSHPEFGIRQPAQKIGFYGTLERKDNMSKIIQIAASTNEVYALRDDGSVWAMRTDQDQWQKLPPIEEDVKPSELDDGWLTFTDFDDFLEWVWDGRHKNIVENDCGVISHLGIFTCELSHMYSLFETSLIGECKWKRWVKYREEC